MECSKCKMLRSFLMLDLTAHEKLVLWVIASNEILAYETGKGLPRPLSYGDIAHSGSMSRRKAIDTIGLLASKGLIEIKPQKSKEMPTKLMPNVYKIYPYGLNDYWREQNNKPS